VRAAIGKFIFAEASCAYRQPTDFPLYPNDHEQPRKLVREVFAFRAQWFDAQNAAPANRSSQGEAAACATEIFQAASFHELEPGFIDPSNFNPGMQQEPLVRPAFLSHFK
jgi:hypothetical protein